MQDVLVSVDGKINSTFVGLQMQAHLQDVSGFLRYLKDHHAFQ